MTQKIRITKRFCFEAAHALYGHDGKCKDIHGHSYKLEVTLIGTPITDSQSPKTGMVMDFSDLKRIIETKIVDPFDHSTILNKRSPHKTLAKFLREEGQKVVLVDYQPTSENMLIDFIERIKPHLPKGVYLSCVKLQETETAFATWFQEDNI